MKTFLIILLVRISDGRQESLIFRQPDLLAQAHMLVVDSVVLATLRILEDSHLITKPSQSRQS